MSQWSKMIGNNRGNNYYYILMLCATFGIMSLLSWNTIPHAHTVDVVKRSLHQLELATTMVVSVELEISSHDIAGQSRNITSLEPPIPLMVAEALQKLAVESSEEGRYAIRASIHHPLRGCKNIRGLTEPAESRPIPDGVADPTKYSISPSAESESGWNTSSAIRFSIASFNSDLTPSNHSNARFKGRLVGETTIHSCDVKNSNTISGEYEISCENVRDPGYYVLEVMLLSLEGEGLPPDYVNVMSPPYIIHDVIYRSPSPFAVSSSHNDANRSTPLCESAHHRQGRWVKLPSGRCELPYCESDTISLAELSISDVLGLSRGLVWAPYHCHYKLFSTKNLHQCLLNCYPENPSFSFSGDSIGREMLQNIQMLLTNFNPTFAMGKLQTFSGMAHTRSIPIPNGLEVVTDFTGSYNNDSIKVLHLSNPHALKANGPISIIGREHAKQVARFFKMNCQHPSTALCFYYVNPAVQHEAFHPSNRYNPRNFLQFLTRDRMRALNEIGRAAAEEIGMPILEGEAVTDAHWFGSWDGLHYSEMMHHFINQDPRWYGGASTMITQALLNAICNRPCAMQSAT